MPLATEVIIAADRCPIFPERCVVCGRTCSERGVIRAAPSGLHGMQTWLLRMTPRIDIVIHPQCGAHLRRRLVGERAFNFLAATAVIVPLVWFCVTHGWSKYPSIALVLVAMVLALGPALIWQVLRPAAIDVRRSGDRLVFQFADHDYAQEFARLNDGDIER
jgi:hypothetical protein